MPARRASDRTGRHRCVRESSREPQPQTLCGAAHPRLPSLSVREKRKKQRKTRSGELLTGSRKLLQCNLKKLIRYFWIPACAGMTPLLYPSLAARLRGSRWITRFVVWGGHARLTKGRRYIEIERRQTLLQSQATSVFHHSCEDRNPENGALLRTRFCAIQVLGCGHSQHWDRLSKQFFEGVGVLRHLTDAAKTQRGEGLLVEGLVATGQRGLFHGVARAA